MISPALNMGLLEVISKYVKDDTPIVEIASGIGYEFPTFLSSRIIRTQRTLIECQWLKKMTSGVIYQIDIQNFCEVLAKKGKQISLFFALNVFDTLSSKMRVESFLQISKLQNLNDRILITLDTNPYLERIKEHLESLYPNHNIVPYFPLNNCSHKLSVIVVPNKLWPKKLSLFECVNIINFESKALESGQASSLQKYFHVIQSKFNLTVIHLEEFFIEQLKDELKQAGYMARVYYHAAFATGKVEGDVSMIANNEMGQDLFYKAVTDVRTIKGWSLADEELCTWFDDKKITLPSNFNKSFLDNLKERGLKIFGAEILVVEAIKK